MPQGRNKNRKSGGAEIDDAPPVSDGSATIIESDEAQVEPEGFVSDDTFQSQAEASHPGRIGSFTILSLLGEGGMGAVYLAKQSEPVERQVALKLVHASLRSPGALARFTAERQALARLTHPNIAALYEAGATDDGFPYFAMELVPGRAVVSYCDQNSLSVEARLQLFCQICAGVHHAHQKGILHRDLKPSNLLVTEVGGEPVPKIIDFGIAKALDEPLTAARELTGQGAVGTPDYMSPEAIAASTDIDTRADVYSLGVVLYELMIGWRPQDPLGEVSRIRLSTDWVPAVRPSIRLTRSAPEDLADLAGHRNTSSKVLKAQMGGDLDWIVMKAIAEEPERRYESVASFAADIGRYLADEPVLARPPNARYRITKFIRRHRMAVAAAVLIMLTLVLGIVGTTMGLLKARSAEVQARLEADRAEQVAGFMTELFAVSDPGEARGNSITARELLDRGALRIRKGLVEQPLLQARLMGTMGDVYGKLGLLDNAVALEEETLVLRETELGVDHPAIAVSLSALGDLYRHQGRYAESQAVLTRALAIRKAEFGTNDPAYAESLNSMAAVQVMLGERDRAEANYRQAIRIRQAVADTDPIPLAASLHHLGWLVGNQQRFEEAESLLERALEIRRQALGSDHYDVAETLAQLAAFHGNAGRYDEAEDLMLQALAIEQKVFEPEHPNIGESFLALGVLYRSQGRLVEAENQLKAAITLFKSALGPEHLSVGRALGDLGLTLAASKRWDEAELAYRRQLVIYEQDLGLHHRLVGEALNNLGWVLSDGLQRYAEGEQVLRRAVTLFERDAKPDDYWNALSRWSLANNLRDQKRYVDARPYYEMAFGILERGGPSGRVENPDFKGLAEDYSRSLVADGDLDAAKALKQRVARSGR